MLNFLLKKKQNRLVFFLFVYSIPEISCVFVSGSMIATVAEILREIQVILSFYKLIPLNHKQISPKTLYITKFYIHSYFCMYLFDTV